MSARASQDRDPTEERPAKRAMREYNYSSTWYFNVDQLGNDGMTFIRYTPSTTEPAKKLVAFIYDALPIGAQQPPLPEPEPESEDSGDSKGSSSSSSSQSSSDDGPDPARGVAQVLSLATVKDWGSIRSKYWTHRDTLDSVPEELRPLLREGLAPFGTFDVAYEGDVMQPPWADDVKGNIRLLSAADIECPGEKEHKKSRKRDKWE